MSNLDILILAVYLISLTYVFYQAIDSFEDQVTIRLDEETLRQQLEAQDLTDAVDIRFGLRSSYGFEPLSDLSITIRNQSNQIPIYVDWDHSSLSDFGQRSRRVIRLSPGMMMDLSQAQIFSVVAPGQTLTERITAEDTLRRNPDSKVMEQAVPLINLSAAQNLPEEAHLEFSLRLVLRRMVLNGVSAGAFNYHALYCTFRVQRVSWINQIAIAQALRTLFPQIAQLPLTTVLISIFLIVATLLLIVLR